MKKYIRNSLSRLGGTWRTAWAVFGEVLTRSRVCLAVVPLPARGRRACPAVASARRRILLALVAVLGLLPAGRVTAQTFTTLHSFTGHYDRFCDCYTNSDGAFPRAGLILSGNTLYGTASAGGAFGYGTLFALSTDGTGFTNLHSFTGGNDGSGPSAGLILSGNILYGTAAGGGSSRSGTVFALNTDGTGFTNVHSFAANSCEGCPNSDGARPVGGLLLSGNTLYGTTSQGGSGGYGTVFAVNTNGTAFTTLHSFNEGSNGFEPYAGLILSGNTLYGTAGYGFSFGGGTVFAVNTDGTGFATLHSFPPDGSDGYNPRAGLILSGNTLYGTSHGGGNCPDCGAVFAVHTDGTGFTNLHIFTGSDGIFPLAGLILSGNTLYGTATGGGIWGYGTVFAINTNGTGFTTLHSFNYGSDGIEPSAELILLGNTLYGTASRGGSSGIGTVFSISFRPQLTITPSGIPPSGIILSWPTNVAGFDYTGYTLQSTTNLLSPAAWVTNSPAPVVIGGQNTVTNPVTGAQKFYRLIQ